MRTKSVVTKSERNANRRAKRKLKRRKAYSDVKAGRKKRPQPGPFFRTYKANMLGLRKLGLTQEQADAIYRSPDLLPNVVEKTMEKQTDGGLLNTSNVVPQQITIPITPVLDVGAVLEASALLPLFCTSNGLLTTETINVNGTPIGVLYLAMVTCAYEIWRAAKDITPLMIEHFTIFNQLLDAMRPKEIEKRTGIHEGQIVRLSYAFDTPDKFFGTEGLFPAGVPMLVGRNSKTLITWPTIPGDMLHLNTIVPNLNEDIISEFGTQALSMVIEAVVSGGNFSLTKATEETSCRESVAVFANPHSHVYPSADPDAGVYGRMEHEYPFPLSELWLAQMQMCVYDPARRPLYTRDGFLGMSGFFGRFFSFSEGTENFNSMIKQVNLEALLYADVCQALVADIYQTKNEVVVTGTTRKIIQKETSGFLGISGAELLRYLTSVYTRMMNHSWVCAFNFQAQTRVLCGTDFAVENAPLNCVIPLAAVERLSSMKPVWEWIENAKRTKRWYFTALTLSGKTNCNPYNNIEGVLNPNDTLTDILPILYPGVSAAHSTYTFAPPPAYFTSNHINPFQTDVSKTMGTLMSSILTKGAMFFNQISDNVDLAPANGCHDHERSLNYYTAFFQCESITNPFGFSTFVQWKIMAIGSDSSWHAEEVSIDNSGVLPSTLIIGSTQLNDWRVVYGAFYDLLVTIRNFEVVTAFQWFAEIARSLVHSQWNAGPGEVAGAYRVTVSRGNGGGLSSFLSGAGGIFKKILPIVGGVANAFLPGVGGVATAISNALGSAGVKVRPTIMAYHSTPHMTPVRYESE